MRVKVTGYFDPEPEEIDSSDDTGLTGAAFDTLHENLTMAGLSDIEMEKTDA